MIITQPTLDDIPTLIEVTKACAKAMISKGVFQWNDNYPSVKVFENDRKASFSFRSSLNTPITDLFP